MESLVLPRRINGQFAKNTAKKGSIPSSNPLLSLATVALATVAIVAAQSTHTPSKLPHSESPTAPKKKRRRSDIQQLENPNFNSERYNPVTLKYDGEHYIVAERGLTQGEPYKRFKRAKKAVEARDTYLIDDEGDMFETSNGKRMEGEGLQASRRCAIAYLFEHSFGNPAKSAWKGRGGVIAKVMRRLDIPPKSTQLVCKVFNDVAEAIANGEAFDPHSGPRQRGRNEAVLKASREANIIFLGIIADIELFPNVLDKIIEARGCVVQDEEFRGLRSGRRAEGSGQLAPKVRRHQRLLQMSSTVPHIEEIAEAKNMIESGLQGRMMMKVS